MSKRTFKSRTFKSRTFQSSVWNGDPSSAVLTGFMLYKLNPKTLLQSLPASPLSYDLTSELGAGRWTLGITRRNAYGSESAISEIEVEFAGGGSVSTTPNDPSNARATPKSAGNVDLRWNSVDYAGMTGPDRSALQLAPTDFQIAEADDLATILATVTTVAGQRFYRQLLGAFDHGEMVTLCVRSRGSGGTPVGPWVCADEVVADTTGPSAAICLDTS